MGHRCNYVVRENGVRTLYASNWGVLSVLRDFFWGLAPTRAFLAGEEVVGEGEWYDDTFGEGGAAIDFDERVLAIAGGELYGPERALCIKMMAALWREDGIAVRDVRSIVEVAAQVGVPASHIEAPFVPWRMGLINVDDSGLSGRDGVMGCVMQLDGQIRFCRNERSVLDAGPAVVPSLHRLPDLAEALALHASRPPHSWEEGSKRPLWRTTSFIRIDTREQRLALFSWHLEKGSNRRFYESTWPGWRLVPFKSGQDELRDLGIPELAPPKPEPAPEPSLEEQLARVEQHLFADSDSLKRIIARLQQAEREGSWVNPRAARLPTESRPALEVARQLYERARGEVVASLKS
jgi:hypothetical protein